MRYLKTILAGMAALMLVTLAAVQPVMAQDAAQDGAQDAAKNMRIVTTIELDPSQEKSWNKAWEDIVEMAGASGYPYEELVLQSRNTRWILTSIENYADIDAMLAARNAVYNANESRFKKALAKFDAATMTSHSFVTKFDPELSYIPEGSSPKPYAKIETYSYRAGKDDEMKAVLGDFKTLATELGKETAWYVYWNKIGSPGSSVTIVSTAANALEMAQNDAADDAKYGSREKDVEKIMDRFLAISLSPETETARVNPDWGMNP